MRSRGARSFSGCSPPSGEDGDNRADWTCYGLYYDTAAPATFDLGCERSNYHGAYRSADVGEAALDYYMLLGGCEGLPSVTRRFLRLTGSHPAVPRWALGYGMTAMPLADAPDAQARITAFVARAAAEGVPASSFHFGSGYTLVGGQRCVFTWNAERFPQPEALLGALHAAGLHVVANVKPCLLDAHPFFAAAAQRGLCVRAPPPDGGPALAQFWDGIGAHVDFGNGDAAAWWTERCGGALLSRGVDAIWNDNNEYEIFEEGATCADVLGGDPSRQAAFAPQRALQPLLMAAASMAATSAAAPGARAFGVSRAMSPGCQRLCSTWTGDNDSSWRSLRWGLRCCMQLALSGMYYAGTDVGGFAGPVPDAELLARWFQAAALLPRMVSNSWKACGTVTSPWLHDYAKPACLAALRPGASLSSLHEVAVRTLAQGIADLGLVPGASAAQVLRGPYFRFFPHALGHCLGLDTHDTPGVPSSAPLLPGCVITVEPGLYVWPDEQGVPDAFRGIGVRIEDDVLITETGAEVLSRDAPTAAEDVEDWAHEAREEAQAVAAATAAWRKQRTRA